MTDSTTPEELPAEAEPKILTPAAKRALAEAEARRTEIDAATAMAPALAGAGQPASVLNYSDTGSGTCRG